MGVHGANPGVLCVKRDYTLDTSPAEDTMHSHPHKTKPRGNLLGQPIQQWAYFWGSGSKPENPEEAHTDCNSIPESNQGSVNFKAATIPAVPPSCLKAAHVNLIHYILFKSEFKFWNFHTDNIQLHCGGDLVDKESDQDINPMRLHVVISVHNLGWKHQSQINKCKCCSLQL